LAEQRRKHQATNGSDGKSTRRCYQAANRRQQNFPSLPTSPLHRSPAVASGSGSFGKCFGSAVPILVACSVMTGNAAATSANDLPFKSGRMKATLIFFSGSGSTSYFLCLVYAT